MKMNLDRRNFRVFGPDETASNRLEALYEATDRMWEGRIEPVDEHLSEKGRVMEILSEHTCEGWLEGYLLTGRHGLFSCYEAFIHIVDSMFNQHAKWLKTAKEVRWRRPIASLNYLLTSHVWRQDHNGFSHQDPGFIDLVVNKKADIVRVYFPPDANCLLSVTDHCLRSTDYINVIVAGKQPQPAMAHDGCRDQALHLRHRHLGMGQQRQGQRAGRGHGLCGDIPTMETLAAVDLLRRLCPGPEDSRGQRGRPDDAAAAGGASARPVRP